MQVTLTFDPAIDGDIADVLRIVAALQDHGDSEVEDAGLATAPVFRAVGAGRITEEENLARREAEKRLWDASTPLDTYREAWRRISIMPKGSEFMRALLDRPKPEDLLWRDDLAAAAGMSTKSLRGVTGPLVEACTKEGVRMGYPFGYDAGSYYVPRDAAERWNKVRVEAGETVTGPALD